jgi:hypothetical protein
VGNGLAGFWQTRGFHPDSGFPTDVVGDTSAGPISPYVGVMSNRIFVDYLPTSLSRRLGAGLAIAALASAGGSFSDSAFAQAKKGAAPLRSRRFC